MAKETLLKARALLEDATPYPPNEIDLNFKFMFGGMGAFARGRMFAAILGEDVALKLPPDAVNDAASEGAKQWVYAESGKEMPMSTYMVMPREIVEDVEQCAYWMKLAIDYVMAQPAKKPRSRKKTG